MKDLRSKKAIAASLSLTLALGSVPAVALADDADENSEGATSEQSAQAELSFSANGGQFTDGSTGVTVKANEDGSINAPTPTRAGSILLPPRQAAGLLHGKRTQRFRLRVLRL